MSTPPCEPTLSATRFADLIAGYCLDVQKGQQVLVRSSPLAAPALLELQRAILERGAWPILRVELPGQAAGFYAHAREWQLDEFPGLALREAKECDATVGIQAPENTRALAGVDPAKIARMARGRREVREQMLKKRWCSTLWPTEALAQQAGMSLGDFETFVERAMFLDRPDPVGGWRELGAFQERLIERLKRASELRIEADGTDLPLSVKGRTWVNSDGRRNMPSGEVFTGPVETSANGTVRFTVRSAPAGVDVDGVELTFRDGEVVAARADSGDACLQAALATDDGAKRL